MDESLKKEIRTFYDNAKDLVVTDDNFQIAQESLKVAKGYEKGVVSFFKDIKEKTHQAHKAICDQEKSILNPLKQAYERVRLLVGNFQQQKENEAREIQRAEEARLRKIEEDKQIAEAEALEKEGRKEEAEAVIEQPIFTAPPVMPQAPKPEGVSYREKWEFSITNPALVPRRLCVPDASKIGQMVRMYKGDFKEPGIKVTCQKIPIVKS